MTDDTLSSLIRACVLAPADAAPRLVLADYLEEMGALTTVQATALRNGRGDWLVGRQGWFIWSFADGDPALGVFPNGDPRTVWVFPGNRGGPIVGPVPADAAPVCRLCLESGGLWWRKVFWLCDRCGASKSGSILASFIADHRLSAGDPVMLSGTDRVAAATEATVVIGFAASEAFPEDEVIVRRLL